MIGTTIERSSVGLQSSKTASQALMDHEDYWFTSFAKTPTVTNEVIYPLLPSFYYIEAGSLISEIESRLTHSIPIFKNDNASVYVNIEEATRGTSVESTIKYFFIRKDRCGAFQALISNHACEAKNRSISKKRLNFLQNIKLNGRAYLLESHVSNHVQAHDDLLE